MPKAIALTLVVVLAGCGASGQVTAASDTSASICSRSENASAAETAPGALEEPPQENQSATQDKSAVPE